jgi:histidinol-phosphate aminotransferase
VVQTKYKTRALAGMRIGFAIGHKDLIEGLDRVKNSFNSYPLDRLAEAAGVVAIEDEEYFQACCAKVIKTREWTTIELQKLGFNVLPSQANFVLAQPPGDAAVLAAQLRTNKLLVRYFNAPRINQFLRITIGSDEQMATLIQVLKTLE